MNVQILNQNKFEEIKSKIKAVGVNNLHVLADFDRTLTTAFVDGVKIPSTISILRNENYLSDDYTKKAHDLFNYYHSFEIDPNLSDSEKNEKMQEWWTKHFNLLIESKLNKKDILKVIKSEKVKFRQGIKEFLKLLKDNNIPLIIFSASGLGKSSILLMLEHHNLMSESIYIISNEFTWDDEENLASFSEPIIHSMNKGEKILEEIPEVKSKIENRRNVILLGDSLGDLGMVEGFDYENLLSIGFLNYDIENSLEKYKENFDVVITNDGSFESINEIMGELI